ncbi:phage XkdN-like protein [Aneurinibacillus aneurinilyticus]|uniref:Phage XkdN-like protein n=1 Tax=Aneurinibacillus aneurinilyticus ATCC 12856 TaxID=649747 RepID=U1WW36_ANEAE|nr:phage XkdN-like protein [Aneurinibacillus aneurinilyticus]ERI06463.1 phage XkdN-like protein [Aneurinibacillus aneurinilyticus ATCC 12856]MED0707078.1 hypothetical protein [Aneurinibacillus aneurinilyticus]MED0732853.1 hypothetical protein [Aneurinibacillus aneurinilyticus]MED0740377.1 hypothetical protein [Aneurinibacillus aneurinilyticus]
MTEENKNVKKPEIKKATIKDLLQLKKEKEVHSLKKSEVFVASIGASVTLQEPSEERAKDYLNEWMYGEASSDIYALSEQNMRLVYDCVIDPNLRDSELHSAYKVSKLNPFEIVGKLFNAMEIIVLVNKLMGMAGIDSNRPVRLVDDLKN